MFLFLYDLLVYLTNNYSSMPDAFKNRFSETFLVRARLQVGTIVEHSKDWKDYE